MTKNVEMQLQKLLEDRKVRQARLAAIDPEAEALRQQLRRARGEAELGDGAAGKAVVSLEKQLTALATERAALQGALEILSERVAAAEVAVTEAVAEEKEAVAAACRQAEQDAFAEVEAVLRRVVQPLQRMAAAHHIASRHGIAISHRAETIRRRIRQAADDEDTRFTNGLHVSRNPGAPGIPDELAEKAFIEGHAAAVDGLVQELRNAGVPIADVAPPEPPAPSRGYEPLFVSPTLPPSPSVPPSAVIRMGRGAPEEADEQDRPVAQSAQPPKGYRGEKPAKPMAALARR